MIFSYCLEQWKVMTSKVKNTYLPSIYAAAWDVPRMVWCDIIENKYLVFAHSSWHTSSKPSESLE